MSGAEKKDSSTKSSKLLDGSSEFVLTYEDKEGDWMLVGDVPWGSDYSEFFNKSKMCWGIVLILSKANILCSLL